MKKHKRIFIFALDGMPLNLARKLAREGVMPNLSKLFKKGWWGDLESSFPPLTATAWVSFATGKDPGDHGIFNFLQPKDDLNNLEVISSHDIKGKTFYEILEEKGKRCIFINLPCSYPSRIKKGVLISSFFAGEDFFYPPNLIEQIPELAEYKVTPDFVIGLNIGRGVREILAIEENRFACGQKLFQKDWDCFFYLVSGTDWVMHLVFDKLIRDDKVNPQVKKIFKKADFYLGWFLDNLPENTAVLVLSDHGFSTFSKVFYINAWLKKNKLLDLRVSWSEAWSRALKEVMLIRTDSEDLRGKMLRKIALLFINSPGFYSLLVRFVKAASLVFPEAIPDHLLNMCLQINPQETYAYALPGSGGQFGLFINDKKRFKQGIVSKKEYPKFRQRIYKELSKILGRDSVWLKEEVYQDEVAEKCADILYCPKEIFVSPAFSRKIFAKKKMSNHSRLGFFLIANKKVKKGKKTDSLKITDLAQTILYLLGVK